MFYTDRMRPSTARSRAGRALNRVKGMPFAWSLNPYTGCVHRCTFCYVRGVRARAPTGPPTTATAASIRVKMNVAEVLRRELARRSWAARGGDDRRRDRPVPAGRGALPPHARLHRGARPRAHAVLDHHARPARLARRRRPPGGRAARRGVRQRLGADARRARLADDRARHGAAAPAARDRPPARRRGHPHERRDRADPARPLRRARSSSPRR